MGWPKRLQFLWNILNRTLSWEYFSCHLLSTLFTEFWQFSMWCCLSAVISSKCSSVSRWWLQDKVCRRLPCSPEQDTLSICSRARLRVPRSQPNPDPKWPSGHEGLLVPCATRGTPGGAQLLPQQRAGGPGGLQSWHHLCQWHGQSQWGQCPKYLT